MMTDKHKHGYCNENKVQDIGQKSSQVLDT